MKKIAGCTLALTLSLLAGRVRAVDAVPDIPFTEETLDNGLHVIYAPMTNAPVIHVRVLYHVGSRDESPERRGFAHMFEHMMFRGSAHVPPEQHMKLIQSVGGQSNAFTSFDQTTYVNTLPSQYLDMALYLEADRMASFKVDDKIFSTERNVVAQEWRQRTADPPYGTLSQDLFKTLFSAHSYRWTPIGDMDQLKKATSAELQAFFNKYYLPNNATLIIAGDIQTEEAKASVRKFFGWIPKGPAVEREIPNEPEQTEARALNVPKPNVPLAVVNVAWKTPPYAWEPHLALQALASILGDGRSSRLSKLLVTNEAPLCLSADAGESTLEDHGLFSVSARVLPGKSREEVEKVLRKAVADALENGITDEELAKYRMQARDGLIRSRETCTAVATTLGEEYVFGKKTERVNEQPRILLEQMTVADVKEEAKALLTPEKSTLVTYFPDPTNVVGRSAVTQAVSAATKASMPTTVAATQAAVSPRAVEFPAGYPTSPPIAEARKSPAFAKGTETTVNGVRVITMTDARLPVASFTLVMRRGGYNEPDGKEGLASMTASMVRRGAGDLSAQQLSDDLESRGIGIDVADGGDHTKLSGTCLASQLDHAFLRARQIIREPTFPEPEFKKLEAQMMSSLRQSLAQPTSVAGRELATLLYGSSPLGRDVTTQSIAAISLEDVKQFYKTIYQPNDAILLVSGDVTADRVKELAEKFLADWKPGELPSGEVKIPPAATARKILLVDNPDSKQATIRLGVPAYDNRSKEVDAGRLASVILSQGIDSRLGKYVRAEKGYAYGVTGLFQPNRVTGAFMGATEVAIENTEPAIAAMFTVFEKMKADDVTAAELTESKTRASGAMVMDTQTITQQASRRVEAILNGYPIDFYDRLPERLKAVDAGTIREVMKQYVDLDKVAIVVVAPAERVKEQLSKLGEVEVVPMPMKRGVATTTTVPTGEMMK